jgi:hypothetical protein
MGKNEPSQVRTHGGGVGVGRKPRLSRIVAVLRAILPKGVGITRHIRRRWQLRFRLRHGVAAIRIEGGENALTLDVAVVVTRGRHGVVAVTDDGVALVFRFRQRVADFGADTGIGIAVDDDAAG